jgi:hypothetical protein
MSNLENARNQALAQFASIREMVEALKAADDTDDDTAREAIEQDALSVEVRSGWASVGATLEPLEFRILLCTGGPAVQIVGELTEHNEAFEPRLQYQDWFTPWTDLHGADLPDDLAEILEAYCAVFYFGE